MKHPNLWAVAKLNRKNMLSLVLSMFMKGAVLAKLFNFVLAFA